MAEKTAILYNPDFQIPRIYNDAQLVLIGINNIDIFPPLDTGWTIKDGVALGDVSDYWIDTGGVTSALMLIKDGISTEYQHFETINGRDPMDYQSRMIYTRKGWNLMRFDGLLTGSQDEEFTFGWNNGASIVERKYFADRRFFTITGPDDIEESIPNYFVVATENGYYEIDFFDGPPIGYYRIGRNIIVEFISP